MKTLKKIDVLSTAKIMALSYAIFSLGMAIFGSIVANMLAGFANSMMMQSAVGGFSLGALITAPIMGAIGGFIIGAISAWIYNLLASWVGGIKVNLE